MQYTDYHSKLWAALLSLRGGDDSLGAISRSIANARVDLNPHQIDAALFALRSPLSKGAILADEVGLGKTIEAGLVLAQKWAEGRRRVLIILPATLRKQWLQELAEKFYLPGIVMETRAFNRLRSEGFPNPFDRNGQIVLCSYQFAAAKADEIRHVPWDLVVIDESHRMRNVYRPSNKTAKAIVDATGSAKKLLLTATPLQNTLLELYGLVSIIDEHVFGDIASFKEQFIKESDDRLRDEMLRERLKPICTRTLRKQVTEYVRYTERLPITQEFFPTDEEQRVYEEVSAYLQRETLAALPAGQRMLITMVLRKLLASSTFAIATTLGRMVDRLEGRLAEAEAAFEDYEALEDAEEEWESAIGEQPVDPASIREELDELRRYTEHAAAISNNSKGDALLSALKVAFAKACELGAPRKAVVFTESRRTEQYLHDLLSRNGFEGKVVTLDGSNSDESSKRFYFEWLARHKGEEIVSGARAVDVKAAIIEEFRGNSEILIATEAGAEGINLQFCSLVVNYDLPWNPQRIEQRIGRCHRYGQEHDVVVVNFLNRRNAADQRVHELLSVKFKLFSGVFGASDEVLGALESGVDIEKRISEVYQTCRTTEEIQAAFDALQTELQEQIDSRMASTRQALLDNFDEEVHARLKFHHDQTQEALDQRQRWLLNLAKHELGADAVFDDVEPSFDYRGSLGARGGYHLDWRTAEQRGMIFFRPDHPLAHEVIGQASQRDLPIARLELDLDAYGASVAALERLRGRSGWLQVSRLVLQSIEPEEFIVFGAVADDGEPILPDAAARLLNLPVARPPVHEDSVPPDSLDKAVEQAAAQRRFDVERKNMQLVDEEIVKLDRWASDLKLGLELEIKQTDREIREAQAEARAAVTLQEKLKGQRRVRDLERRRNQKRRDLFEAQDRIDDDRNDLIQQIEKQLVSSEEQQLLVQIAWSLT